MLMLVINKVMMAMMITFTRLSFTMSRSLPFFFPLCLELRFSPKMFSFSRSRKSLSPLLASWSFLSPVITSCNLLTSWDSAAVCTIVSTGQQALSEQPIVIWVKLSSSLQLRPVCCYHLKLKARGIKVLGVLLIIVVPLCCRGLKNDQMLWHSQSIYFSVLIKLGLP